MGVFGSLTDKVEFQTFMTGSRPGLKLTPNTFSVSQFHNMLCSVLLASNIHLTCSSGNSYISSNPLKASFTSLGIYTFSVCISPKSMNRKSFCCGCHPFCYFQVLYLKKNYRSFLFEVPNGAVIKNPPVGTGDEGESASIPGLETSWSRKWQPAPVFLPGKPHGQQCLTGYSPWGLKESDTTDHAHRQR